MVEIGHKQTNNLRNPTTVACDIESKYC